MNERSISVLLVEDNPGDARLIQELLTKPGPSRFSLECADTLTAAAARLDSGGIDVVLLDLGLPESQGFDTFARVQQRAGAIPIVVLTGADDDDLAARAVQKGAQDYLVKGELSKQLLTRSLRYALERTKIQDAIRESEAKNRALLAAMPDMTFHLSSDGTYLEFLPGSGGDSLLPPEQFIGRRVDDVMPADLAEQTIRDIRRVLETGTPQVHEYELLIDDEVRYYEYRMVPYGENEAMAVVRDITERRRLDESLRFAQFAVDHNAITTYLVRADGGFDYVNDAACDMLGYSCDELLSMTVSEIAPKDPRFDWPAHWAEMKAAGCLTFEGHHRTKAGKVFPVEVVSTYLEYHGREFVYAYVHDITERKGATAELERSQADLLLRGQIAQVFGTEPGEDLYANVLDVVIESMQCELGFFGYIHDEEGLTCPSMARWIWNECRVEGKDVVFPHSAWGGLWGRSLMEREILYSNDPRHLPDGHVPLRNALAAPIIHGGTLIGQLTVANRDRDFTEQDKQIMEAVVAHLAPLLNARLEADRNEEVRRRGELEIRTLNASLEERITERAKVEQALKDSHQRLRNLTANLHTAREEERAMIVREMHDELGQLLTGIRMDLSWLSKKGVVDEETLERVDSMTVLVDRTADTVRRIAQRLRPAILDDLGLEAAIEWQVQELRKHSGLTVNLMSSIGEASLDNDRATAVFRILQESLTNVARHAEASEIYINLELKLGQLVLSVTDDGKGITEDQLANADSLGLTSMRERAGMFGGRLTIGNFQGGGTKVALTMPRASDPQLSIRI